MISDVVPAFGPHAGGTLVTIVGQGLDSIAQIKMECDSMCTNIYDKVYERHMFENRYKIQMSYI